MQPTNEEPRGSDTYRDWQPPSWSSPGYPPPPPAATITTARPWLIAISAFLTLLVLIAAFGNQWVTDAINRHTNTQRFGDNLVNSVRTYQWRFNPPKGGDFGRFWVGSLVLVGTALILTLLLVAIVSRGRGGFWQSFFGAWLSVVFATLVAAYVRDAVIDTNQLGLPPPLNSKPNAIFFSPASPGPYAIAAGVGFGFVVGPIAGLTAVLTRRTEVVAAPETSTFDAPYPMARQPSEEPRTSGPVPGPTSGPSPGSSGAPHPGSYGSEPYGGERTRMLPNVGHQRSGREGGATTQLPRTAAADQSEREGEGAGGATTQPPRTAAADQGENSEKRRSSRHLAHVRPPAGSGMSSASSPAR
jgi:hypothetical protein